MLFNLNIMEFAIFIAFMRVQIKNFVKIYKHAFWEYDTYAKATKKWMPVPFSSSSKSLDNLWSSG